MVQQSFKEVYIPIWTIKDAFASVYLLVKPEVYIPIWTIKDERIQARILQDNIVYIPIWTIKDAWDSGHKKTRLPGLHSNMDD